MYLINCRDRKRGRKEDRNRPSENGMNWVLLNQNPINSSPLGKFKDAPRPLLGHPNGNWFR